MQPRLKSGWNDKPDVYVCICYKSNVIRATHIGLILLNVVPFTQRDNNVPMTVTNVEL